MSVATLAKATWSVIMVVLLICMIPAMGHMFEQLFMWLAPLDQAIWRFALGAMHAKSCASLQTGKQTFAYAHALNSSIEWKQAALSQEEQRTRKAAEMIGTTGGVHNGNKGGLVTQEQAIAMANSLMQVQTYATSYAGQAPAGGTVAAAAPAAPAAGRTTQILSNSRR